MSIVAARRKAMSFFMRYPFHPFLENRYKTYSFSYKLYQILKIRQDDLQKPTKNFPPLFWLYFTNKSARTAVEFRSKSALLQNPSTYATI
jgi:hypothetical protein